METLRDARAGDAWDALAARGGTVFHRGEFLDAMAARSGWRCRRLVLEDAQGVQGVLPIFQGRRGPFRLVASPPPGCGAQYLGPALLPADRRQDEREVLLGNLAASFDSLQARAHAQLVLLRCPPEFDDVRAFQWRGYDTLPRYTYRIDLRRGPEAVWDAFRKKVRNDVRRASSQATVQKEDRDGAMRIADMVARRYREQGLDPPIDAGYIDALWGGLGGKQLFAFSVVRHGQEAGGLLLTVHAGRVAHWQGAARTGSSFPANELLIWETVRWACEAGLHTYELMGANTERLCTFKAKFNPHLELYHEVGKARLATRLAAAMYRRVRSEE